MNIYSGYFFAFKRIAQEGLISRLMISRFFRILDTE